MHGAVVVHATEVARGDPLLGRDGMCGSTLDHELRRVRAAELQRVVARAHGDAGQRFADVGGVLRFARFADRQPWHRLSASVVVENRSTGKNGREIVEAFLREASAGEVKTCDTLESR